MDIWPVGISPEDRTHIQVQYTYVP